MRKQPKAWTWEQCEARSFHPWDGKSHGRPDGVEQCCRSCGVGAVETMNRREAAAKARREARTEREV